MRHPDDDGLLHISGIGAETGQPLVPAFPLEEVLARGKGWHDASEPGLVLRVWRTLRSSIGRAFIGGPELGARDDVDLTDPRSAGWAVVVASDAPVEARMAADRLFEHRRAQTGVPSEVCKKFEYPAGQSMQAWLASIGAHASDVVPTRLPYYVTFVGGPASIPFEAQSWLNAQYAVGRLAFDEPDGYLRYVTSLIEYENSTIVSTAREVAYWGTRNRGDAATRLSCDYLIQPLFGGIIATSDHE